MTTKQKVVECILKNRELSDSEIAQQLDTTGNYVRKQRSELRKEGKIPPLEKGWNRKWQPAIEKECEDVGLPLEDVKHYWYKGKHFSVFVKGQEVDFAEVRDSIIEDVKKYAPQYPVLKREKKNDPSLFLIDPCDPHFGAYSSKSETGSDYNLLEATKRYNEGFEGLLNKASFYENEKIVIIGGNDVSHTDTPFRKTTSGTPQDTDGMWYDAFHAAKRANIGIIERALTIADVHFIHCPSNHDYQTGFFLAQVLQAWFHSNKNVTFDISPSHRKYLQYGRNLIGATHGDGAKEQDLPAAMTREAKKAWSESDYAYWYTHHMHHKIKKARQGKMAFPLEKDGKAVSVIETGLGLTAKDFFHVEYLRSIKPPDSWHHRNSFDGSFEAMEGFIHHPEFGQISRLTHLF